mmetsp:Transcript_32633/g.59643  ORF Transcript_32633/g.59643 Transcript_32633/m.59643 type:complete len:90 (-) Transcript_32633:22-291(-)
MDGIDLYALFRGLVARRPEVALRAVQAVGESSAAAVLACTHSTSRSHRNAEGLSRASCGASSLATFDGKGDTVRALDEELPLEERLPNH